MPDIIKTENLDFAYNNEDEEPVLVLRGLDIKIRKGSFVAVLGRNGSGKSTLAKHFNAVLLPSGGKVYIDGIDTADEEKLFTIRQTAGMVFQNPDNQIVATIVEEDVAFGPENLGVKPEMIRKRVNEALETVGMTEYAEHSPNKLSGGQKQRVAIAGILAMKPKCIILDEPTTMLDPAGRKEVFSTIRRLNKDEGITIVLITHFMDEAAACDRVVVMDDGKILLDGSPREVFQNAGLLKSVGLDVPQATELMFALRAEGFRNPLAVLTAEECVRVIEQIIKKENT